MQNPFMFLSEGHDIEKIEAALYPAFFGEC